jgi:hypothetical protein
LLFTCTCLLPYIDQIYPPYIDSLSEETDPSVPKIRVEQIEYHDYDFHRSNHLEVWYPPSNIPYGVTHKAKDKNYSNDEGDAPADTKHSVFFRGIWIYVKEVLHMV